MGAANHHPHDKGEPQPVREMNDVHNRSPARSWSALRIRRSTAIILCKGSEACYRDKLARLSSRSCPLSVFG
jgi:hypothetical protein